MKKIFTVVACAAVLLTACTKPEQTTETLPAPAHKNHHASLTFSREEFANEIDNGILPITLDLTSDGHFVMCKVNPADGKQRFVVGEYTFTEVKSRTIRYDLGVEGKLEVLDPEANRWKVKFTTGSGASYDVSASLVKDRITGAFADDLCRSWRPVTLIVSAKGGDLPASVGVAKTFKVGGDLKAIANYLHESGVQVTVEQVAKFNIKNILFTEAGKVYFNFKDSSLQPYSGTYNINAGKEENFSYNFDISYQDNPVIPVKGDGTITFTKKQMSLYTEADVTVSGKVYRVSLTIVCEEDK